VMRSMRCFALERVVLGWLHCGCTALQPAVLPCNMAFGVAPCRRIGVRRTQGVRHGGTQRDTQRGTQARMGRGTSLAVVGRADHVGLVRRTRRLGLRTASPRAPSASRRRAGGASACRRALHGLHELAERTRAEGDARAQRGGRVRVGWGGGRAEADRLTAVSAARGLGCGRERGVQHALHVRIAEHAAPAQHSRRQPA
jgi:hypothetical protein